MGLNYQADIPGNHQNITRAVASFASSYVSTDYVTLFVAPYAGKVLSAYVVATASQNSHSNVSQYLAVVDMGAAGTGTTVCASLYSSAGTAAAYVPRSFTTTAHTVAAGDVLAVRHISGSTGTTQLAADYTIVYSET